MSWLDRWRDHPEDHDEAAVALRERAHQLAGEVEPVRDLWPGVARRIAASARDPRPRVTARAFPALPRWALSVATAVLLVVTTALATLWLAGGRDGALPGDAEAQRIASTLRGRDGVTDVHRSLLAILDERRDELPADTLAAIEENLRLIDRALTEIHLAMERHPDNHVLGLLLAETYRREADLLEQVRWWSRTPAWEPSLDLEPDTHMETKS